MAAQEQKRQIVTPKFRVSFPALAEAKTAPGSTTPKFSVVALFDKATDLSELKALAKAAVELKWPDPAKRPKGLRSPFRDGSEKEDIEGYAGTVFCTLSSKLRPGVVDKNAKRISEINDIQEQVYPGCYGRATVIAYAYDNAGNRGVAFGLQNFQKLAEGEPLGGRTKPEDDFGPVEGGEGAAPQSAAADDFMS